MGKHWERWQTLFSWASKSLQWWLQPWNSKTLTPWEKSYEQPRQHIKKQRHYFVNKGPSSQSYGFSSRRVWMWELDYKEGWLLKNWCFWTVVLEKILESLLDCKEIKPVNPKGNQSWIFIGRTDAEAETPILWPPDAKSWLIGKFSSAVKDWGHEETGTTEDEVVRWHHRLSGHEFEQSPGDTVGQRSLVCCGPWGCKQSDMTSKLNNNHSKVTVAQSLWGKRWKCTIEEFLYYIWSGVISLEGRMW